MSNAIQIDTTSEWSKQQVTERFNAGEDQDFMFFWSEPSGPRSVMNQWHPSTFFYKNFKFSSAEQAMMAEKALLFGDVGTLYEILGAGSPRAAKALGRQVIGYVDKVWGAERLAIVRNINVAKFSQNPTMLKHLLSTGNRVLVEASPYDHIWGIGMTGDDPAASDPNLWQGRNLLGQALMEARDLFRPLNP